MELALRHGALRERIAAQRQALAGVDWLKAHPEAVGVAVAVAVVASPKRAWRWTRRAFFVWRGWRSVRNSLLAVR